MKQGSTVFVPKVEISCVAHAPLQPDRGDGWAEASPHLRLIFPYLGDLGS
jgi:hypothetical protein